MDSVPLFVVGIRDKYPFHLIDIVIGILLRREYPWMCYFVDQGNCGGNNKVITVYALYNSFNLYFI